MPRLTKGHKILCEAFCDMQSLKWHREKRVEGFTEHWVQFETRCPGAAGLMLVTTQQKSL